MIETLMFLCISISGGNWATDYEYVHCQRGDNFLWEYNIKTHTLNKYTKDWAIWVKD